MKRDWSPKAHPGTPPEYFNTPLGDWLTFDPGRPPAADSTQLATRKAAAFPRDEPTPDEIRQRTAELRKTWPPERLRENEGDYPAVIPTASERIFAP